MQVFLQKVALWILSSWKQRGTSLQSLAVCIHCGRQPEQGSLTCLLCSWLTGPRKLPLPLWLFSSLAVDDIEIPFWPCCGNSCLRKLFGCWPETPKHQTPAHSCKPAQKGMRETDWLQSWTDWKTLMRRSMPWVQQRSLHWPYMQSV